MKYQLLTIIIDEKEFAFVTGLTFRGLTVSESEGWWNIILRARQKDGTPVYFRTVAPDITEGFSGVLDALSARGGESMWHFDRYAQ